MCLLDTLFLISMRYTLSFARSPLFWGSLSHRQEPKSCFSILIYVTRWSYPVFPSFFQIQLPKIAQRPSSESQLPKVMWSVRVISISIKHLELEYTVPKHWQTSASPPVARQPWWLAAHMCSYYSTWWQWQHLCTGSEVRRAGNSKRGHFANLWFPLNSDIKGFQDGNEKNFHHTCT